MAAVAKGREVAAERPRARGAGRLGRWRGLAASHGVGIMLATSALTVASMAAAAIAAPLGVLHPLVAAGVAIAIWVVLPTLAAALLALLALRRGG